MNKRGSYNRSGVQIDPERAKTLLLPFVRQHGFREVYVYALHTALQQIDNPKAPIPSRATLSKLLDGGKIDERIATDLCVLTSIDLRVATPEDKYELVAEPDVAVSTETIATQCASLESLIQCADSSQEAVFQSAYTSAQHEAVRQVALKGLHKACSEATIEYFKSILSKDVEEQRRIEAIDFLCRDNRTACNEAIGATVISQLSVRLRIHLAKALFYVSFPPPRVARKVESLLRSLIRDDDSRVRGAALACWCEWSSGEGYLDRQVFWTFMAEQDVSTIEELFDSLQNDTDLLFVPYEDTLLVRLAEQAPSIRSSIVYALCRIGGEDVAVFMSQFMHPLANDRRWAFSYFARCPSPLVEKDCEREMRSRDKRSHAVVAAAILLRLGHEEVIDFLISSIESADYLDRSDVKSSLKAMPSTTTKDSTQQIDRLLQLLDQR